MGCPRLLGKRTQLGKRTTGRGIGSELAKKIRDASELDLAKIGLTALIDEATGYQNHRGKDELAQKLEE